MLRCGDLQDLPVLQKIKYLTGESGKDNAIRWIFVPETEDIAPWIHGGELLIISGAVSQRKDFKLGQVLMEAMRLKMAGAVMLVGDNYIQKVPKEALARAEAENFAIMAIPWNVPIVDIQESVARAILERDVRLNVDNALDLLLNEKISAREYAGFILEPFAGQEEKNHGSLLETLSAYFACNGNIVKAADMLMIHRNTMKYRIGQVERLLNCSLEEAKMRLKLHLALYIREHMQEK